MEQTLSTQTLKQKRSARRYDESLTFLVVNVHRVETVSQGAGSVDSCNHFIHCIAQVSEAAGLRQCLGCQRLICLGPESSVISYFCVVSLRSGFSTSHNKRTAIIFYVTLFTSLYPLPRLA